MNQPTDFVPATQQEDDALTLFDIAHVLRHEWKIVVAGGLVGAALALAAAKLMPPTYVGRTTFLPPQNQQSSSAAALASLGALAGIAGGGIKSPADQYVALMQSVAVADRLVDKHDLIQVYDAQLRTDARLKLERRTRILVGRKDGMVSVEVDDANPARAALIANDYVAELRRMTSTLAVSEAQQRRAFFERELQKTRDRLAQAQVALQSSGFTQSALRAEPRAAAEGYARIKAEITSMEVRLQAQRGALADSTPEVQASLAALSALRSELSRLEQSISKPANGPDYISKYREFKYQETLFELFSRQYEIARVDESREGALIQIVDLATPPERQISPRPVRMTAIGIMAGLILAALFVISRRIWRSSGRRPQ